MALRGYSKSQKVINRQLSQSEQGFERLLKDYQGGSLPYGTRRVDIVARYSEPVLSWQGRFAQGEVWRDLYRYPCQYFGARKIYLYYDTQGLLTRAQTVN